MTEIIRDGAGIIAANYLSITGEPNVKFRTIAKIKSKLEFELMKKKYSIYIDTTRDSIINALNNNPNIFDGTFERQEIICKNKKRLDDLTDTYFNAKIPNALRKDFKEIISEIISTLDPEVR